MFVYNQEVITINLCLKNAKMLLLQGSGPGWTMQVIDMANITTGDMHQYCLNGMGGPISITLVWHDYPAALPASSTLVNDLDLTVRAAGLNGFPLYVRSSLIIIPRMLLKYSD